MKLLRHLAIVAATIVVIVPLSARQRRHPPLTSADIDAIARILQLEDTRQYDDAVFARLVAADEHPEVRRRAVLALGRIPDPRGRALLTRLRDDSDVTIVTTVAFSDGQLKDSDSVAWLAHLLESTSPVAVAREAARSLGKIRTPEARVALVQLLTSEPASTTRHDVVGEALLSLGRFPAPIDLPAVERWIRDRDPEVRWRAAWALFRPRDPRAVPDLLQLSHDSTGDVRLWAVRGLTPPMPAPSGTASAPATSGTPASSAAFDAATASARLRDAMRDTDRRVRTEALRALGSFDDDASFAVVNAALDSTDTWLSVSAAEALGHAQTRKAVVVPRLEAASATGHPTSVRITALASLAMLAPDSALPLAADLARDRSVTARAAARQALQRLGTAGRAALAALPPDPAFPNTGGGGGGGRGGRSAAPARPLTDYRRIVERWIVTDYDGAKKPHVVWDTPRGSIELELYPGDAPLGVDAFMQLLDTGAIAGTEFGRVVPDFVAQQRTIPSAVTQRDEVNLLGLTRGNLSWASSGLDTGRPGYTLGSTPQPHNEGDFTSLGHVVSAMDVVDRLELGDAVTAARVKR